MRSRYALLAIALAAATTSASPVVSTTRRHPQTSSSDTSGSSAVDAAAVALLPADIKKNGKLIIGIDPSYAPNEFKDDAGNPVGWDVELADAMAAKLGLKTEYQPSSFDKIIPSITGGTYDIGVSSFTDNAEREKAVDFVNYFTAGVQWAQPIGKTVDPANACGLTVVGAGDDLRRDRRTAGQVQGVHRRRQGGDHHPQVRQAGRRHHRAWPPAVPTR